MAARVQKKETLPVEAPKTSVAVAANIPAYLQKHIDRTQGQGYSHAAEDSLIPMVTLLQQLSPQLKPNNEKYVRGAKMGDILLKGALNPLVKGDEGIVVQPCAFQKAYVEWVPRSKGGGFVARHDAMPMDVVQKPDPENDRRVKNIRTSNGNEVIETRYHFVRINGAPYVIPFTSTGHTTSREWTNLMKTFGQGAPAWAALYRLTPALRTKGDQEWFVFKVEPVNWVDSEGEFLAGEALFKAVMSGAKMAEEPDEEGMPADEGVI